MKQEACHAPASKPLLPMVVMMTKKTTEPRRLTMLDLMVAPKGPPQYTLIQGGQLEYSGEDWRKAGQMMSWLRSYRWGEVCFFKDGVLMETLEEPKYEEPPRPRTRPAVTVKMIRAAQAVVDHSSQLDFKTLKRVIEAAIEAIDEDH